MSERTGRSRQRHIVSAFRQAPVAAIVSEELSEPLVLDPAGSLAVAMDPLDGSSNIDANVSIGTIFSILPCSPMRAVPSPFPATRSDADRRRLRHLWATDLARVRFRKQSNPNLHFGPARRPVLSGGIRSHHRQGMRRIRHKRLQLQALGRSGPGVIDDCVQGQKGR